MNELQVVRALLAFLKQPREISAQRRFSDLIKTFLQEIKNQTGQPFGLSDLYRSISSVEQRCLTHMLPSATRKVALATIKNIEEIVSIQKLVADANSIIRELTNLDMIILNLDLLDALYDETRISEINLENIERTLESMSNQIAAATELSDSHRSMLAASLELVRRTTSRLKFGEISEFQDSVLCAVGRMELSLKGEVNPTSSEFVRSKIDDLLRIAGMFEIGEQAVGLLNYLPILQIGYST